MKIAVLSDIHCNKYALGEALKLISEQGADHCFFLGDYFGYYPWALETYNLLKTVQHKSTFIIGNHDEMMIRKITPDPIPDYWDVSTKNKEQLPDEAINWLNSLKPHALLRIDGLQFSLYHGTPDDELNGRFYPDNDNTYKWFPQTNEVVLLGHTHYKILKQTEQAGFILNPGSVGQARGKNTKPSFALIDTGTEAFKFVEINYDVEKVISELENINWYPRAVESLKKSIEH